MNRRKLREAPEAKSELFGLDSMSSKTRQSLNSVDDQIDSYILKYETDSIKKSSEDEIIMESLRRRSLRFLLEEEDTAPPDEDEDAPDAEPAKDSTDTKKRPASAPKKPPLDIDAFTKKVVRLVMNYKNLMRIEPAIINRASDFLEKNYGQDYVDQMHDILETQFDFNLEGEEEIVDVPIATGAGVKGTSA